MIIYIHCVEYAVLEIHRCHFLYFLFHSDNSKKKDWCWANKKMSRYGQHLKSHCYNHSYCHFRVSIHRGHSLYFSFHSDNSKKRIDVEQTNKWAGMDNIWWSHIVIIIYCHFRVSTCLGSTSRGKKRTRTLMIYLQVYKDAIKLLQIFQVLWMLGN